MKLWEIFKKGKTYHPIPRKKKAKTVKPNPFGISPLNPDPEISDIDDRTPVVIPPIKEDDVPIEPGKKISIDVDVKFNRSSSTFRSESDTQRILGDLIKTLKEYPQLQVSIFGNFVNDKPGLTTSSKAVVKITGLVI